MLLLICTASYATGLLFVFESGVVRLFYDFNIANGLVYVLFSSLGALFTELHRDRISLCICVSREH